MNGLWRLGAFTLVCATGLLVVSAKPTADRGRRFLMEPLRYRDISTTVQATGTVEAVATADVGAEVSGLVDKVFVTFNDPVVAGQPLAQLDQAAFRARVEEARAALEVALADVEVRRAALRRAEVGMADAAVGRKLVDARLNAAQTRQSEAERELQRKLTLSRAGAAADREVSLTRSARDAGAAEVRAAAAEVEMKVDAIGMAEADLQTARAYLMNAQAVVAEKQAALDEARVELGHTVIHAPFDGVVIDRAVNPGQAVAVGLETKTLFRLAHDLKDMQVRGAIAEADVGLVKKGQEVRFAVDAYPKRLFAGRVIQVRKAPDVRNNVVTYSAIVSAPNADESLFPGMTATLDIATGRSGPVLAAPNAALHSHPDPKAISSDGSATVWTLSADGRPRPQSVRTGASDDDFTEVIGDNVREGERVIVGVRAAAQRGD